MKTWAEPSVRKAMATFVRACGCPTLPALHWVSASRLRNCDLLDIDVIAVPDKHEYSVTAAAPSLVP